MTNTCTASNILEECVQNGSNEIVTHIEARVHVMPIAMVPCWVALALILKAVNLYKVQSYPRRTSVGPGPIARWTASLELTYLVPQPELLPNQPYGAIRSNQLQIPLKSCSSQNTSQTNTVQCGYHNVSLQTSDTGAGTNLAPWPPAQDV